MLILSLCAIAQAQNPAADTTLPVGAKVAFETEGRGVQIYICTQQGSDYKWTLKAPDAKLFDPSGKQVGTHSAGPTWTWEDGSAIQGKLLAKHEAPKAGSVPWLLLVATPVAGTHGVLSDIAFVRRSDTSEGVAPATGCDAQHGSAETRVAYRATYTFYKSEK